MSGMNKDFDIVKVQSDVQVISDTYTQALNNREGTNFPAPELSLERAGEGLSVSLKRDPALVDSEGYAGFVDTLEGYVQGSVERILELVRGE